MGDGGSEVLGSGDFTALNRSPYDRIAALYAENQAHNQSGNERWFSALERSFLASVPAEGLVADLGCGPGSDGARFAGEGYRVVGMDLSAGRQSQPDASMAGLRRRDLRRLPLVLDALADEPASRAHDGTQLLATALVRDDLDAVSGIKTSVMQRPRETGDGS